MDRLNALLDWLREPQTDRVTTVEPLSRAEWGGFTPTRRVRWSLARSWWPRKQDAVSPWRCGITVRVGTHPAVIVSNPVRVERKPVVVLACRTLRPGTERI